MVQNLTARPHVCRVTYRNTPSWYFDMTY